MKEHPIIFSTPMVQAILAGRKTMTRRIVKIHSYIADFIDGMPYEMTEDDIQPIKCPYGQPGDVLWVRETFRWFDALSETDMENVYSGWQYKADVSDPSEYKWKPSIHMPYSACRIKLIVKSVRVERLQDITEEDAIRDGVIKSEIDEPYPYADYRMLKRADHDDWGCGTAKESFRTLWESIHGPGSWEKNTWVWVIEFQRKEG